MRSRKSAIFAAAITFLTMGGSTVLADTGTTTSSNSNTYSVTVTNESTSTTTTSVTSTSSDGSSTLTSTTSTSDPSNSGGATYTINIVPIQPLNTANFPEEPLVAIISNDTGFPAGVTVHFQSSNPQIASVPASAITDTTGAAVVNVKAETKSGSATITISVGNQQKTVTVKVDASSGNSGITTTTSTSTGTSGSKGTKGGDTNFVMPTVEQDISQLTLPADNRTESYILLRVTNKGKPMPNVHLRASSRRPDVARVVGDTVSDASGMIRIGVTAGHAVGNAAISMTMGAPDNEMDLKATVQTTQPVSPTHTSYPAYAGITGQAQNTGSAVEMWGQDGSNGLFVHTLRYNPNSNEVSVQGIVRGKDQGQIYIQVTPDKAPPAGYPQFWGYTIPTHKGTFSTTITLPYHGGTAVAVCDTHPGRGFDVNQMLVSAEFTNPQPTLSLQQMGLLQSWAVNYTEAAKVDALATGLATGSPSKLDTMRRVSDWVSRHIAYDWVSYRQNKLRMQQASYTLDHRVGVCEDETALGAAMLREDGIPAQFIYGSAGGGPHAWLRAWDGHAWITLDPTWDQVYYQNTTIALPTAVTFKYFNPLLAWFDQSHHYQGVDPW